MKIPHSPVLLALIVLSVSPSPAHPEAINVDAGHFNVFLNDRPIGTEQFSLDLTGDSLVVQANSYHVLPRRDSNGQEVTLQKQMGIITGSEDFELRNYISREVFRGDTITRGIIAEPGDTLFTLYKEKNGAGEGDRRVLPPGRIFVIDAPPLFTTFNLICRTLHGRTFDQRPMSLLMLGVRDTVMESMVADLGTETIRWGSRPVQARKLDFRNSQMHFIAWVSPAGLMLRLEEPEVGLRAERDPPPIKGRPKRG
jgi:hypothetical protein